MSIVIRTLLVMLLGLIGSAALAQGDYRIRAGDTLVVEVLEDTSLNRSVIVLPDGRISFPFAGSVRASGRTVGQVETALTEAITSQFASRPNVFVSVQPAERVVSNVPVEPVTINIYFLGEVNDPGVKEVEPGVTFLQAMALSGGMTRFAAGKRVQLRRGTNVTTINLKALLDGTGVLTTDLVLQDGDVIMVPERRLFE